MAKKKVIKIGVDLDGVVARHSLGGFWVWARKLKEKILKKMRSSTYYYPITPLEQLAWKVIDGVRKPFVDKDNLFTSFAKRDEVQFYLVTSRFKFLEKLTQGWLKKYRLGSGFYRVLINTKDIDPFVFKAKAVKNHGLGFFIDDDLEVINYLKNKTKARLYWVVPDHKNEKDNPDSQVKNCQDFPEALKKISEMLKNEASLSTEAGGFL